MTKISVVLGDIVDQPADVMILKYADRLHGVDRYVSECEGVSIDVPRGEVKIVRSKNTSSELIAFFGVGNLFEFDYLNIRSFAASALSVISRFRPNSRTFTITSHGPGYGLDEKEAFLSLVEGLDSAFVGGNSDHYPDEIVIVEKNANRQIRYERLLEKAPLGFLNRTLQEGASEIGGDVEVLFQGSIASSASAKRRIFLAMPFAERYEDEFTAIREACESLGVLCERVDIIIFSGEILERIKRGISECDLFIAVLNDENPNVFLEIGYAWGVGKNFILIMKEGANIPFDVRSQRIVMYTQLFKMRDVIKNEIAAALRIGVA